MPPFKGPIGIYVVRIGRAGSIVSLRRRKRKGTMTVSLMQIIAAIAMLGVVVALIVGYRQYLAANSERRMRAMLESVGLDPALAAGGEIPAIINDVRNRCQTCASEEVCERWLTKGEDSRNEFCPNSKVFEILSKYTDP